MGNDYQDSFTRLSLNAPLNVCVLQMADKAHAFLTAAIKHNL